MTNDNYHRTKHSPLQIVRVGHLPFGVSAREISNMFEQFGEIINLYLKRRIAKDSDVLLANPFVILAFDKQDSVDRIMASRPFYMGDCHLFVRRFMPITHEYRHDAYFTVKKIIIYIPSNKIDQILPDDKTIADYLLATVNGKIEYLERLNNRTVLVQFDDYDPVDLCCLLRPHFINNQPIEIEKCKDEEQIRHQIMSEEKLNSFSIGPFYQTQTADIDSTTMNTTSPIPILSIDDQMTQIRSSHNERINQLESEHEQYVATLVEQWKQIAKERIRFERLTSDLKNETTQIQGEYRKWQRLYSESLKEKPIVQKQGEEKFNEASQAYEQLAQKKSTNLN